MAQTAFSSQQLRQAADYAYVFAAPEQRLRGALWLWLVRAQLPEVAAVMDSGRLGLAIARKHLPHAVERNRMKRVARAAFREYASDLRGLDLVLLSASSRSAPARTANASRPSKTERRQQAQLQQQHWRDWLRPRARLLTQFRGELARLSKTQVKG